MCKLDYCFLHSTLSLFLILFASSFFSLRHLPARTLKKKSVVSDKTFTLATAAMAAMTTTGIFSPRTQNAMCIHFQIKLLFKFRQ